MPRKKSTKIGKMALLEGWKTFGLWLRSQRMAKHFTQRRAAKAVGVSRQQWLRYEYGDKVPYKRLHAISEALDIRPSRIFYLAGYKVPPRLNDANVMLRRMHDRMRAGDIVSALEQFFLIYEGIGPTQVEFYTDGITPPNFARAVTFLEALPLWLFERIVTWGQQRLNRERSPSGVKVRFRNLILKECIEELYGTTPSVIDTYPEVSFVGPGRPETWAKETP
jgi:transcriptional regulator with XRE-family HTH domain